MRTKLIPLNKIIPSPFNPRVIVENDASIAELADSILNVGLINSISVRPVKLEGSDSETYEIICGERRFMAHELLKMSHISANIYDDISDEKAMEMILIENVQRKDVPIIEEIEIFVRLIDMGKTVKEVSELIGKTVNYIYTRLALNRLIPELKDFVAKDKMSIVCALEWAKISDDNQKMMYDKFSEQSQSPFTYNLKDTKSFIIRNFMLLLSEAKFSLTDTTLGNNPIPCVECPFNTGYNSLFPDEVDNAKCTNKDCFDLKTLNHTLQVLQNLPEDTIVVVEDDTDISEEFVKEIVSKQNVIQLVEGRYWIKNTSNYTALSDYLPDEIVESDYDIDNYDSEKDMKADFIADKESYEEQVASTREQFKDRIISCFSVNKLSFIDVLKPNVFISDANTGSPVSAENTSSGIYTDPTRELTQKLRRNEELKDEKILSVLTEHLRKSDYTNMDQQLSIPEYYALFSIMINRLGLHNVLSKLNIKQPDDKFEMVKSLTPGQHCILTRDFLLANLLSLSLPTSNIELYKSMLMVMETFGMEDCISQVKTIEEKYAKRRISIQDKISAIEAETTKPDDPAPVEDDIKQPENTLDETPLPDEVIPESNENDLDVTAPSSLSVSAAAPGLGPDDSVPLPDVSKESTSRAWKHEEIKPESGNKRKSKSSTKPTEDIPPVLNGLPSTVPSFSNLPAFLKDINPEL